MAAPLVAGNYYDKYRTRNPLHRRLVDGFLKQARELCGIARPANILEVGCGPGDLAHRLLATDDPVILNVEYLGVDICTEQVELARLRYPKLRFEVATAYDLPFAARSYDLVVACEVLEHLDEPERALEELSRVAREWALISVPWEPVWCGLNMLRGKYLRRLGNTPGHVNHFTRSSIRKLVATRFDVVEVRRPFPWTMLLARQREAVSAGEA